MAQFVGTYKFEKDDGNFQEFLKAMGVNFMIRKVAGTFSPTITINVKDDGTFVCKTVTSFKEQLLEFKLGEEFEEKRMDGVTVKTTIKQDGNKLIQTQETDPPLTIVREFTGDRLISECSIGNVVCVREYKKQ